MVRAAEVLPDSAPHAPARTAKPRATPSGSDPFRACGGRRCAHSACGGEGGKAVRWGHHAAQVRGSPPFPTPPPSAPSPPPASCHIFSQLTEDMRSACAELVGHPPCVSFHHRGRL